MLVLGLILIFGGSRIARLFTKDADPVALTRMLQAIGLALIVMAFLIGPRSPESTAFPPPPQ
jgi:Na+-driven multidrug efflux pump